MDPLAWCVQRILAQLPMKSTPQLVAGVTELAIKELNGGLRLDEVDKAVVEKLLGGKAAKAAKNTKKARSEEEEHAVEEEVEKEVFETYACRLARTASLFPSGATPRAHPGDVVESGLLASVQLPRLTYCGAALDDCVSRGALSDLQAEGVLHACQRHSVLTRGLRSGFFLGDGAGVGKGRQISAIVLDNVARGRVKHVWFSIASDLKVDAERDLGDVACHLPVIDGCQSLDAMSKLAFGSSALTAKRGGLLFSTYSTLISTVSSKGSRLEQLITWCGGEAFEGCLVFDEAHKAKNFVHGGRSADSSTKVSQAVIALQNRLPRARVVFASATGVTEIMNMAYATRLGLWGPGTAFESFGTFSETMDKRGVGALEMLALELKTSGAYVSRGLSWARCEFEHLRCTIAADTKRSYDALAAWWRALRRALQCAFHVANIKGGALWSRFWTTELRVFKEVQTACKVPFVVDAARKALARGECVVIGLQSTGESGLDAAMQRQRKRPGDTVSALVSGAQVASRIFVEEAFPVAREKDAVIVPDDAMIFRLLESDQRTKHNMTAVTQADVDRYRTFAERANAAPAPEIAELKVLKQDLLDALDALDVPPSPLDALIDALGGPGAVAELTGRSSRIVRSERDGRLRYEIRGGTTTGASSSNKEDSLNIKERKRFMDAKKRVAIISDAASTGISLHAACGTASAHLRRNHVTLELAWSADKSIQQLGRSHRANEASAPVYHLVTTDLAGETRFGSAVAKRLASLGALTKGDRRAASGQDMSEFDFDTRHGRQALTRLAEATTNRFDRRQIALGVNPRAPANAALGAALDAALAERDHRTLLPAALDDKGGQTADVVARFLASDGENDDDVDDADAAVLLAASSLGGGDASAQLAVVARRIYADLDLDPKNAGNVKAFLNRLQAQSVASQSFLFEYFMACFRAVIADAKANGTFDAGVADLRASSAVVDTTEVVGVDAVSGAQTVLYAVTLDRGVSFDQALEKLDASLGDPLTTPHHHRASLGGDQGGGGSASPAAAAAAANNMKKTKTSAEAHRGTGWYVSRRPLPSTRKCGLLLAVQKANNRAYYVVTRPNTGTSPYEMTRADLHDRYLAHAASWRAADGDVADLRLDWTQQYDDADATTRGGRRIQLGLVSGAVLPFWHALEKTVTENRDDMSKADQALKVCRVVLDSGTKLVGIRFPAAVVDALKANLHAAHEDRARHAAENVESQPPTPIDAAAFKAATTARRTILSFFKPAAAPTTTTTTTSTSSSSEASSKPAPARSAAATSKKRSPSNTAASISPFFPSKKPKADEGVKPTEPQQASPQPEEPSAAFSECPCCAKLVETARINHHLDNDCKSMTL